MVMAASRSREGRPLSNTVKQKGLKFLRVVGGYFKWGQVGFWHLVLQRISQLFQSILNKIIELWLDISPFYNDKTYNINRLNQV